MKRLFLSFSAIVGLMPFAGHAEASSQIQQLHAPIIYEGVDISPVVDYFNSIVDELEKPVKVYNWSSSAKYFSSLSVGVAQQWARTFWNEYGKAQQESNMYGRGLYAAVDPVATRSFGGSDPRYWLLLEMQLPKGLRLLDLTKWDQSAPAEIFEIEDKFKCPKDSLGNSYFSNGGAGLNPKCQNFIREVFQNHVQVDAFFYLYISTEFSVCPTVVGNNSSSVAFVIMRPDWLREDLVNFYTAETEDRYESRRLIQTLFLENQTKERSFDHLRSVALSRLMDILDENPDLDFKSTQQVCAGKTCSLVAHLCDSYDICEDKVLLNNISQSSAGLITKEDAEKNNPYGLLWNDLDYKPKSDTVTPWLFENKLLCDGKSPFRRKK